MKDLRTPETTAPTPEVQTDRGQDGGEHDQGRGNDAAQAAMGGMEATATLPRVLKRPAPSPGKFKTRPRTLTIPRTLPESRPWPIRPP